MDGTGIAGASIGVPGRMIRHDRVRSARDEMFAICEQSVALALQVPLGELRGGSRGCKDVALARQIAMYLANTSFEIDRAAIGQHFQRDRTTVTHALHSVEDRRDDADFDTIMEQIEAMLGTVRTVWHRAAREGLRGQASGDCR